MKEKQIAHIRLINGDELISKIQKKTKNTLILENPLIVDEMKNPETGQANLLLARYNLSDDPVVSLRSEHVITISTVSEEIAKYYNNSLVYNMKFIDGPKNQEIQKVNHILETLINETTISENNVIILKEYDRSRVVSNSSNTIN